MEVTHRNSDSEEREEVTGRRCHRRVILPQPLLKTCDDAKLSDFQPDFEYERCYSLVSFKYFTAHASGSDAKGTSTMPSSESTRGYKNVRKFVGTLIKRANDGIYPEEIACPSVNG